MEFVKKIVAVLLIHVLTLGIIPSTAIADSHILTPQALNFSADTTKPTSDLSVEDIEHENDFPAVDTEQVSDLSVAEIAQDDDFSVDATKQIYGFLTDDTPPVMMSRARLQGDINGDGMVNALDLNIVRNNFGQPVTNDNRAADINGDGFINALDLNIVRNNFGKTAGNDLPPGVEEFHYEYRSGVKIVHQPPTYTVTESGDSFTVRMPFASADVRGLVVGDVFVLEPTLGNPMGTAGRVTTTSTTGNEIVITAAYPQDLDEIYSDFEFVGEFDLLNEDIEFEIEFLDEWDDGMEGSIQSLQAFGASAAPMSGSFRPVVERTSEYIDVRITDAVWNGITINGNLTWHFPTLTANISRRHADLYLSTSAEFNFSASASFGFDRIIPLFNVVIMPVWGVTLEIPVGIRITASGNFELVAGCSLEVGFGIRNGSASAWANFDYHFSFTYDARASISLNLQARARLIGVPIYGINGDFGRAFQINNAITARCPGISPNRCFPVVETSHVRRINSLTNWGLLRGLSFLRFNLDLAQNLPRTTWFRSFGTWHRDACPHARVLSDVEEAFLGVWEGTYHNSTGLNGMRLSVFREGSNVRAIFEFFPVVGSPAGQRSGSYNANVLFNESAGIFTINGTTWIDRPGSWVFVSLSGTINGDIFTGVVDSRTTLPFSSTRVLNLSSHEISVVRDAARLEDELLSTNCLIGYIVPMQDVAARELSTLAANVSVGIRQEAVTSSRTDANIYRLIFAASAPNGFSALSTVFSYDNAVIVPVNHNTHADVGITAGGLTVTPFRSIIMDTEGEPFTRTASWGIAGDRTGFQIDVGCIPANRPISSAAMDVYAFYFRVINNDTSRISSNTFRIEDARRSDNIQGSLAANFGIVINGAHYEYIWGAVAPSVLAGRVVINDASVMLPAPSQNLTNARWASVSTGRDHTLGIQTDGSLWAWGHNGNGQLGDGTTTDRLTPVYILPGTTWTSVSAGESHTLGIQTDGSLWTWGWNRVGCLGDGTTTDRHTPVHIQPGTTWTSVSAGVDYSIGIRTDGSLWAWGSNWQGQLGDGITTERHVPAQILPGTTWQSVSARWGHTLGIRTDGSLWAWGRNNVGQVGDGTTTERRIPVPIQPGVAWANVSAGDLHTLGIRVDGNLWVWGWNELSQLGDGTTTNRHMPVQIQTGITWKNISAGFNHTLGIRADGSLWAWGSNQYGKLGDGTISTRHTPVQILQGTTWASVSVGSNHTVAIQTDGSLWVWGRNERGRLGLGHTSEVNTPQRVMFPGDSDDNQPWQPPLSTNIFNDVPNGRWPNNEVSWAERNGITKGTSPTTFSPDDNVTRAEFVTFLHRIFGSPAASKAAPFTDMPGNPDFRSAISWAYEVGVTTGTSPTTFSPNDRITREQIAAMLHRYIGDGEHAPDRLGSGSYTDHGAISTWTGARPAVNWAVHNGIKGVNTTTLNPRGNATRAEAVTMLYRVVGIFNIPAP